MKTQEIVLHIKNTTQLEFSQDSSCVFFIENDKQNRPYKMKMIDLNKKNEVVEVFEDTDPTHYIDFNSTKDKTHFLINSNTKEDSEVFIMKREPGETP
jgi:protease II